jgi:hypothetical protein
MALGPSTKGVHGGLDEKAALVTGVFFVVTFVAAIPAVFIHGPVLDDPNYIVGAGADTHVALGAFLEVITAIANIAIAVTCSPSSSGRTRPSPLARSPLGP